MNVNHRKHNFDRLYSKYLEVSPLRQNAGDNNEIIFYLEQMSNYSYAVIQEAILALRNERYQYAEKILFEGREKLKNGDMDYLKKLDK